ncbi:MAG: DUF2927 domain-containing protein [Bacteroidota bacterium]
MKLRFTLPILWAALILWSCSPDDPLIDSTISYSNFYVTLNERPQDQMILGLLDARSSIGEVDLRIISQSPADALTLDTETGQLSVKDSSLFDINDTELIRAQVAVTDSMHTETLDVWITLAVSDTVISYFQDIALGFEFGNASEITRKWSTNMKVFVDGDPSQEVRTTLENAIQELNSLATDGFAIELVEDRLSSNCYLFFGTENAFLQQFPDAADALGDNWGLFTVWFDNDTITRARIFVDTRRPAPRIQRSLTLEELVQPLGLAKDSPRFPNSIFYETRNNGGFAEAYSDLDRELVRLLYHPRMTVGLNKTQAAARVEEILKSEW